MRALDYSLRQAWASLWRGRGSSLFAVLAIALALVVLGLLLLVTWNVEQLLARWASAAEFSVYLRDDATSEQRGAIEAILDGSGVSAGREYVSKAEALRRFQRSFAELASLTTGFEDNPFPASVEVRVHPGAERDGRVEQLVQRLAAAPGVADVRYDREWLARIAAAMDSVRLAGLSVAALMIVAAVVTVATVVRLGLHSRRDELEIMALVGSPLAFIRGPFVAEGVLQGGTGALAAVALLWIGYAAVQTGWGADLAAVLDSATLEFLPPHLILYLIGGGMLVGGLGGLAAARHAA